MGKVTPQNKQPQVEREGLMPPANQTETPHLDIQGPSKAFKAQEIISSLISLLYAPHI